MKQLTVFVENRKGGLAEITRLLAESGVDMKALSIADTRDFGILRLIVSEAEKAEEALKKAGFLVQITEVVGVKLPDRPGALASALDVLDQDGVNLEYLYAFLSSDPGTARVVLRVADNIEAAKILTQKGFEII